MGIMRERSKSLRGVVRIAPSMMVRVGAWTALTISLSLICAGAIAQQSDLRASESDHISRVELQKRLTDAKSLGLDSGLAKVLSDSMPDAIAREVLDIDAEYMGVIAGSAPLGHGSPQDSAKFRGQRIFAFTEKDDQLYLAVTESDSLEGHILWNASYRFGLPQPRLWRMSLGIEGDSSTTIGMVGIVSPSGYKGYIFLLWTGETGRIVASAGGLALEHADIDHNGIEELIVETEDREGTLIRDTLAFEPDAGTYRRQDEIKRQPKVK